MHGLRVLTIISLAAFAASCTPDRRTDAAGDTQTDRVTNDHATPAAYSVIGHVGGGTYVYGGLGAYCERTVEEGLDNLLSEDPQSAQASTSASVSIRVAHVAETDSCAVYLHRTDGRVDSVAVIEGARPRLPTPGG